MKLWNTILFSSFLLGLLFLFASPTYASQAECMNRVLFPNAGVQRFYHSEVFDSWKGWESVNEDWSDGSSLPLWGFLQNCFDNYSEGIMQIVLKNTSLYSDMNFAVVIHADVTNDGYLYEDEVENIHSLGAILPVLMKEMIAEPRVQEYIKSTQPTQALLYVNHESPVEFGIQKKQDYSGIVLRLSNAKGISDQSNATTYFEYDYYTGYVQYQMPLGDAWQNFSEIENITGQYSHAASSVSSECSADFTDQDSIRGILLPARDWNFHITSSRESCPPYFSSVITAQDRSDMGIENMNGFATQKILNHTPSVLLFPCGVMTTLNFQHIFFRYFTSALGICIMIVGLVLFGAHLIHAMYAYETKNTHKQKKIFKKRNSL